MRFDWYAATVREDAAVLIDTLAGNLGGAVVPARGLNGYDASYRIETSTGLAATVLAGGRNGNPHALASGDDTDAFVTLMRAMWPEAHRVTRMDAAEDWVSPEAWGVLAGQCLAVADERNLKVQHQGDWHREYDGRTIYVGSPKSPVRIRLYEKGKQLRSQMLDGGEPVPTDWCRLEVQVRPQRESRDTAATAEPVEAWGYAAWTRELVERCLGVTTRDVVNV